MSLDHPSNRSSLAPFHDDNEAVEEITKELAHLKRITSRHQRLTENPSLRHTLTLLSELSQRAADDIKTNQHGHGHRRGYGHGYEEAIEQTTAGGLFDFWKKKKQEEQPQQQQQQQQQHQLIQPHSAGLLDWWKNKTSIAAAGAGEKHQDLQQGTTQSQFGAWSLGYEDEVNAARRDAIRRKLETERSPMIYDKNWARKVAQAKNGTGCPMKTKQSEGGTQCGMKKPSLEQNKDGTACHVKPAKVSNTVKRGLA